MTATATGTTPPPGTPLTVALQADHYVGWVGGATLLGGVVNSLLHAAALTPLRLHVLLDARRLPAEAQAQFSVCATVPADALQVPGPLAALRQSAPLLQQLVFYRDLASAVRALEVDVVGPTAIDLGEAFPRPWFAYIPDFQHQYLAHYFSAAERTQRDAHFRGLLEHAHGVFVNAATVAADVERFHPAVARSKPVLRFAQIYPDVSGGRPDRLDAVRQQYRLPAPYLLSCSQRWTHKRHDLIVAAFAEHLRRQPHSPLHLVFTGHTDDYRDPGHAAAVQARVEAAGLGARVHTLGLIPREDQQQLIRGAEALLSATEFEGGAGASGVIEAALLGTPVLASDIPANRELPFGRLHFFAGGQSDALAEAIGRLGPLRDPARAVPPFGDEALALLATAMGVQMVAALRSVLD